MGDFPLMTPKGTFVINGTERVVVSQLVRSPGVYFERTPEKTSDKDIYSARIIPSRGAWLEFEIDKRDQVGVRIDRKRKQSVTVFLKALGLTSEEILEEFAGYESIDAHPREGQHPHEGRGAQGHLPQAASGRAGRRRGRACAARQLLLQPEALRPRQGRPVQDQPQARPRGAAHRLGAHGRRTSSPRSSTSSPCTTSDTTIAGRPRRQGRRASASTSTTSTTSATVASARSASSSRTRCAPASRRMERVVRERMTTQDIEAITPQTLINVRPVVAAIKEFFGTSQLSQFMDQNNPLAGLTHKRRLSALGPGGLSRDRAGVEVRDVHPSHYGRMCPIETPEGPNIGLIGSLASFARINSFGFIETPYRKRRRGQGHRADRLPHRDGGGRLHRRPGQRAADGRLATSPSSASSPARRAARSTCSPPTRSATWMSRRARWCRSRPRSSRSSSTTTRTAPSWVRTCSVRLCRCCAASRRSSAPAWRATRPSTPATSITADKAGVVAEVSADCVTVQLDEGGTQELLPAQVRPLQPGHELQPPRHRQRGRPHRGRRGHRRRPRDRERRARARQEPPRRVHAVGGPQLRGRDHPQPEPGEGRRALLDPHRGVRGRRARHEARQGGDHP